MYVCLGCCQSSDFGYIVVILNCMIIDLGCVLIMSRVCLVSTHPSPLTFKPLWLKGSDTGLSRMISLCTITCHSGNHAHGRVRQVQLKPTVSSLWLRSSRDIRLQMISRVLYLRLCFQSTCRSQTLSRIQEIKSNLNRRAEVILTINLVRSSR